jgi:hypothetical protein
MKAGYIDAKCNAWGLAGCRGSCRQKLQTFIPTKCTDLLRTPSIGVATEQQACSIIAAGPTKWEVNLKKSSHSQAKRVSLLFKKLPGSCAGPFNTHLREGLSGHSITRPNAAANDAESSSEGQDLRGIARVISSFDELISLQREAAPGAASQRFSKQSSDLPELSSDGRKRAGITLTPPSKGPNKSEVWVRPKKWVRDSTGTMRRAPEQGNSAKRGSGKIPSPSRMKLPKHGPPRAAAVTQILDDADDVDLTLESALDQLAEALQLSELNMVSIIMKETACIGVVSYRVVKPA